jgi:hypothetical protein
MNRIDGLMPCLLLLCLSATGLRADDTPADVALLASPREETTGVIDNEIGGTDDAGSRATVLSEDVAQDQRGAHNLLRLHMGNALAGGRSQVTSMRIRQSQRATHATQGLLIGNAMSQRQAEGTHRHLVLQYDAQWQAEQRPVPHTPAWRLIPEDEDYSVHRQPQDKVEPSPDVNTPGQTIHSGSSVMATRVTQTQRGTGLEQLLHIGNTTSGGKARVVASDIQQFQSGDSNVLSLIIGDVQDGPAVRPFPTFPTSPRSR